MKPKVKMIKPPAMVGWPTGKGGSQSMIHEGGFFEPDHCKLCQQAYRGGITIKARRVKK